MEKLIREARLLSAALVLVVLSGCAGLPETLVREAARTQAGIEEETRRVENSQRQYGAFPQSAEYGEIGEYAERENWADTFAVARAKVDAASSIFDAEVAPAIEKDDPQAASAVQAALQKVAPLLTSARQSAQHWLERRDFLVDVLKTADTRMRECESALGRLKDEAPGLTARSQRAKRDHEARGADIDELVTPLTGLLAASEEAFERAKAEFGDRAAGRAFDLAAFGDSCELVTANSQEFVTRVPDLVARLAELDRSYSRTLIDMKIEYGLLIRRESWDDGRDYPTSHLLDFRVTNVNQEAFEHLASVEGSLAGFSHSIFGSRFSLRSGAQEGHWNSLGIDPLQQWPRGDNKAEYWVQGDESRYFHKYLVQENGETGESDWIEVTESLFFANIDNLGMDVEAKAYGSFASEKLTHAAPPGMAYVGNPRYGRWASDGAGGSVWTWMGPYLFYSSLFGQPIRYGRSEWDTWSGGYRGSRPYYGGSTEAPRWGTRGQSTRTSPKMQGSTFARTGGFRRPASTVRGAGPMSRGGSFGASGK